MLVVVNTSSLPVYRKYRIASLLCIFETSVLVNRHFGKQWRPRWNAASSGSALFAKIKTIFRDINASFHRNFNQQSLKIQNGHFHTYSFNIYGIIHQNEKDLLGHVLRPPVFRVPVKVMLNPSGPMHPMKTLIRLGICMSRLLWVIAWWSLIVCCVMHRFILFSVR